MGFQLSDDGPRSYHFVFFNSLPAPIGDSYDATPFRMDCLIEPKAQRTAALQNLADPQRSLFLCFHSKVDVEFMFDVFRILISEFGFGFRYSDSNFFRRLSAFTSNISSSPHGKCLNPNPHPIQFIKRNAISNPSWQPSTSSPRLLHDRKLSNQTSDCTWIEALHDDIFRSFDRQHSGDAVSIEVLSRACIT